MNKTPMIAISAVLFSLGVVAHAADNKMAPAGAAGAPAAAPAKAGAPAAPADKAAKAGAPAAPGEKAAAPAAGAPMAPPKPAPEVDQLYKSWEGNWKCDTTFPANAMGPGSPEQKVKSEVKIKKDMNGFWYRGEYTVKKTKAMPAMNGVFMLGYDTATKNPVNVSFDSMGSYVVGAGAPGYAAEKVTFMGEGHMMGMKVKVRETMTKKSDKEAEHTYEVDMGKGFMPMGTDVCKK